MGARRGNIIWRPNCALDRRTLWCLWNSDKIIKHVFCFFVGKIKGNERTKEEQTELSCCGIRLRFTKKYTVWPRNVSSIRSFAYQECPTPLPPPPPCKSFDAIFDYFCLLTDCVIGRWSNSYTPGQWDFWMPRMYSIQDTKRCTLRTYHMCDHISHLLFSVREKCTGFAKVFNTKSWATD